MNNVKGFSINKRKSWLLKTLIMIVTFLGFVFLLNFFANPIKNGVHIISSPIQKVLWSASQSSSSFFKSFLKAGSLAKENSNLKGENQKLLSQVAALQSIVQGNQAQSDVSQSCQNTGFKLLMAGVVGLDDNDILSINKGSADKVFEGMPVISQQGVLFGKVFKVYNNFSQVMLVSNKNSIVNVKVQQSDSSSPEVDGVVKGIGGLSAYLDLIPISSEINQQDFLVTSAIDKSFPKDLLVGRIVEKQKNDQKPFQEAKLDLFFDVNTADNLFVITNYKQPK